MQAIERLKDWLTIVTTDDNDVWGIVRSIEDEIAERYVELPVDAGGEPVRVGDVLEEHEGGHTFEVDGIQIWGRSNEWWAFQDNGVQAPVGRCTHHRVTVEDVLRKFLGECEEAALYGHDEVPQEVFDAFAEKLQLREVQQWIALKPCPFCGAVDEVMTTADFWSGAIPAGSEVANQVGCTNCDIWTPPYDTEKEAIEAWNRRAES